MPNFRWFEASSARAASMDWELAGAYPGVSRRRRRGVLGVLVLVVAATLMRETVLVLVLVVGTVLDVAEALAAAACAAWILSLWGRAAQ